jgi:GTP cyclohydrolase II
MSEHVNIENDEVTIPYYAIHRDGMIFGFFGPFRFLSNFYILENGVCLDEIYYPSVEHAYQAAKWPYNMRDQFLGVTAGRAKKLGREAPKFNAKKWDKQKVSVMAALCRQKFLNNPKLKAMLLMTEGCQLEERNNWGDVFWGRNEMGDGQNQLGQILMDIRHDLLTNKEMF